MELRNGGATLTRRSLLQRAGTIVAAAAVPSLSGVAAQTRSRSEAPSDRAPGHAIGAVMVKLSAYMSEARNQALPDDIVEKMKHHVLDTLAAMISGSDLPPGRAALQFARAYGGEKIATIAGSKVLSGPMEAALTNGMLAHADETDDTHGASLSHPGCYSIPAALAAGEQFRISGTHFLRAVALGYDIGPRVTMTLGAPDFMYQGHKSTFSFAGTFGASAAASCAASLNTQQMRWVLDYASQQASGIAAWQRDTDHIEKGFVFAGMPARNGVMAALVVQAGWTGVDDVLSGVDNFLQAYGPQADPAGLIEKLGERYEVTRSGIKKWTVGAPIQAPLDALQNLLKKHPFEPDQVKEVIVRLATGAAKIVDNREIPDICLQHMMAVMLIDKTVSFHSAHDKARTEDPAVLRQRAKVQLVPDEELDRALPARVAIVEVTLTDGTRLRERVEAVRGTPENPMTREEVVAKARSLMTPVIGTTACTSLVEKVFQIEDIKDIRELRPLLRRA